MKSPGFILVLAITVVTGLADATAWSAEQSAVTASPSAVLVSGETVNARLEEIESSSDLDEKTKAALLKLVRKTLANLETIRANNAQAEHFLGTIKTAPGETGKIRAFLESEKESPSEITTTSNETTPFEEVERELLQEKANLAAVNSKLADLQDKQEAGTTRPDVIRQRLIEARKRQADLVSEQKLPPPDNELPWLTEVRGWAQATGIEAMKTESRMLDQELLSHSVRFDLLAAQVEQATRNTERIIKRTKILEDLASRQGRAEAREAQARAATFDATGKHKLVQQLADENAVLSKELNVRAIAFRKIAASDDDIDSEAKRIEESFRAAREKLEVAGMSEVLGEVLRKEKLTLPNLRKLRAGTVEHERDSARIALRQIQDHEEYRKLRNDVIYIDSLTAALDPYEVAEMRSDLVNLVKIRIALLENVLTTDKSYLRAMTELGSAYRRLYEAASGYDAFLAEKLLWIRSAPLPGMHDFKALPGQFSKLLSPSSWTAVVLILVAGLSQSLLFVLMLLVVAVLFWKQKQLYALLRLMGNKVGKPATDEYSYTLKALGLTLLLAMTGPLLLWAAGWELSEAADSSVFVTAVSRAFLWLAPFLFYLQFFSVMCMHGGVAEKHFQWTGSLLDKLRREFNFLKMSFPPLAFIIIVIGAQEQAGLGVGLLRIGLIAVLASLAIFFYRLSGLMVEQFSKSAAIVRQLWVVLTILVPLLLAILVLLGYFYTVATLVKSLVATLWFVFGLVVLHQMVVRWLLLIQRRLALQAVRDRIRATREKARKEEVHEDEGSLAEFEEPEIDLVALSTESRKLLNTLLVIIGITGFWLIWQDVLPAFGILNDVTLWHQSAMVAGEQKILPVTLADIGKAILIAIATLVATQRLPALLEIILMQRFRMSSANRYTVTTLTTYTIVAIGVLLFFNIIGADWSKLQWLFAALSVGIGFGLQEIVANFISGLIILFERPIRVGDVVTVGETSGVVTRIRIRATTIRNWERQELLVPNKEFITNQLLNWSLSDQTTRIKVPVGVAYGSDVQKAMSLMDEAARENENVLQDPKPSIIFESFGDNTLNLVLRCFVGEQDVRITTITRLHTAINDKFSAAGITIAFPQRDVHLDTTGPLEVRIRKDNE